MAILETDTIYYRADHPLGYEFSAGAEVPPSDFGWVLDPADIAPLPPREYECTTLEAYEALLRGERAAGAAANAALAQLSADRAELFGEVQRLTAQLAQQQTDQEP